MSDDAVAIWRAGVCAVDAERLVRSVVHVDDGLLSIAGVALPIVDIHRLAVVGAGKAGAGMAAGLEQALGPEIPCEKVTGWVNVPADCVRPLGRIHLHAARPAGVNEPTPDGVAGAEQILQIVSDLEPADVCVVLLSGGGSALLPAPALGVTLDDKQRITRLLMQAGARIDELNCVRKHLSRIKGGRLARACRAGQLITLVISDVIGDPLDVIASGPTVEDPTTAADALQVLRKYAARMPLLPPNVTPFLEQAAHGEASVPGPGVEPVPKVSHAVIGNIDVALRAAGEEARRRGYPVHSLGGRNAGVAREVGAALAEQCLAARSSGDVPRCLLSGGEPIVELTVTDRPRSGGRNQELVLAAADRLWNEDPAGIVILSGGTDGEDGPTDAAGAWIDAAVLNRARRRGIHPADDLAFNNSYAFFAQAGGHLKTGPTHTNVMDLRVCLVKP
ncbi:MAG: glycerate kinase [Planctomycetaceae bacterium]